MATKGQLLLQTTHVNRNCFHTTSTALLRHSPPCKLHNQLHFAATWPSAAGCTNATLAGRLKAATSDVSRETPELPNCSWDNLGFELVPTDYMYIMKCYEDDNFSDGQLQSFGAIEVNPFASVLNNGQGVIDGLKAYRRKDGSLCLFRPQEHGLRMRVGADSLCMPAPTVDQFVEAVKVTVSANKRWVPPPNKGFLYVRPLIVATGAVFGLNKRPPEFTFLIYVSPVRTYFKADEVINLVVDEGIHRAVPGAAGSITAMGNYAAVMQAQVSARTNGYYDFLYLDALHKRYVEGTSSSNIFLLKDKTLSTPLLNGMILPGITRDSIIGIARSQGFQVEERDISVDELLAADEVFCTGNAIGLVPVDSITYQDKRISYSGGGFGSVSQQLSLMLTNIQMGVVEDKMGWTVVLK